MYDGDKFSTTVPKEFSHIGFTYSVYIHVHYGESQSQFVEDLARSPSQSATKHRKYCYQ